MEQRLGVAVGLVGALEDEVARRRDYARFVWTLFRHGDVAALPMVEIATCTTLHATAEGALPLQADGDIIGELPATMTVTEAPLVFC